jgi:TetR/AcrR family transcriptional repressor of nem operon
MARPRSFAENEVLDTAVERFWRRGYAATSVRDLGEAMGLGQASFYNAFGDKQALFARALDRYLDSNMRERILRLEATLPPRRAIEAFLEEIVERSLADPDRCGCLLVNTALEVAPHDAHVADVVAARFRELEGFFRRCVKGAQKAGTVARNRKATDVGHLMLSTVVGLRVLARVRPERALLEGILRQALAALD